MIGGEPLGSKALAYAGERRTASEITGPLVHRAEPLGPTPQRAATHRIARSEQTNRAPR